MLFDFLGCANLLWSGSSLSHGELADKVRSLVPSSRFRLSGVNPPSLENNQIKSIDISGAFNVNAEKSYFGVDLNGLKLGETGFSPDKTAAREQRGMVAAGVTTDVSSGLPDRVVDIRIGPDASSLIFLHTCAREAGNEKAYRKIYNFDDTAELLGWYEVVYEDGFVETIPVRYGVNILDINVRHRYRDEWEEGKTGSSQNIYAYPADLIECSENEENSKNFFAFEWRNPRFGEKIESVNLVASRGFKNYAGKGISPNAIFLLGINYVERRPIPDVGLE